MQTELHTVALDGFVKQDNLPYSDVLKIDAEGIVNDFLQIARGLIPN